MNAFDGPAVILMILHQQCNYAGNKGEWSDLTPFLDTYINGQVMPKDIFTILGNILEVKLGNPEY